MSDLLIHKDSDQSQAPPAPPPMQPIGGQQNPYDFITKSGTPVKKSLFPSGNSKTRRLIIVGGGAIILIMLIVIVVGLINSGGSALKTDYQSLAQQQTELIRVSGIGRTKARQSEAKNLAVTTQYTLTSQQSDLLTIAKKAGASTDVKVLALGKDAKTDTILETADQSNQFDEMFLKTLLAGLKKYQLTLKKLYDSSSNNTTKDALSKAYNSVDLLLGKETKQ